MPRLPNALLATIADAKLTRYLLSLAHPRGRGKARFFKRFGFPLDDPQALRQALLQHAREHDVARIIETPHGVKYEIKGPINAPDGRRPVIKTVWIIDHGSDVPRFVTAQPGKTQRR